MKQTRLLMGMPITVEIVGSQASLQLMDEVFAHFACIDNQYSMYKPDSEISRINRGLPKREWSAEMKHVLELCAQTKRQTNGYFNIEHAGRIDPSGLVKGWAIAGAADLLRRHRAADFCIEAGGDVQLSGVNRQGNPWIVGIRNPFNATEVVKRLTLPDGGGVATSGTAIRGQHIYNPYSPAEELHEVASLTVLGGNIYDADRFATAAFAMGRAGINFIETLEGFEGYMITADKMATATSGLERDAR